MIIESFKGARHSLVSAIGPTMGWNGEKVFKIKVIRRLENIILRLVFANAVLRKITILLMFRRQNSQKV